MTVKISNLPAATSVSSGDVLPVVQSGTTKKVDLNANWSFGGDVLIADKIVHAGDTNTAIRFPSADTVTFETSGAEAMRIDSSGNVGIGLTNPSELLQVNGFARANNLPITRNGVYNTTESPPFYEIDGSSIPQSEQFGRIQGLINSAHVGDVTITVRFKDLANTSGIYILKLYQSLLHGNSGSFDIVEKHFHFFFKRSTTSALSFPTTPAYTSGLTGQANESANMTLSNPSSRGLSQGAPIYVQFDLALSSGRSSPQHKILYELIQLRTT